MGRGVFWEGELSRRMDEFASKSYWLALSVPFRLVVQTLVMKKLAFARVVSFAKPVSRKQFPKD